jgi:crotonobetainyl-CoA:carnitine CoA-transferase CaiB-like acyl-CoA transferase
MLALLALETQVRAPAYPNNRILALYQHFVDRTIGPYSKMAGHDINYIAVSGLLSTFGRANENPIFPGNILGDFAGGGMLCVMGILMALLERTKSGKGQVIDAAMVDGSLYLGSFLFKVLLVPEITFICMERTVLTYQLFMQAIKSGLWAAPRGHNLLDSGAPFYDTYKTKDGKYLAIGALEPHFFAKLIKVCFSLFVILTPLRSSDILASQGLGLDPNTISQYDQGSWPELRRTFEKTIGSKTQSEWQTVFDGTDACVTPVVDITEINNHKHIQSRNLLIPDDTGFVKQLAKQNEDYLKCCFKGCLNWHQHQSYLELQQFQRFRLSHSLVSIRESSWRSLEFPRKTLPPTLPLVLYHPQPSVHRNCNIGLLLFFV